MHNIWGTTKQPLLKPVETTTKSKNEKRTMERSSLFYIHISTTAFDAALSLAPSPPSPHLHAPLPGREILPG